jgi:N-acyl-D-amino-acid deacylase
MMKRSCLILVLACTCSSLYRTASQADEPSFDVVLRNGKIVDGTGAPWYYGDVGIRDGKIVSIGRISDDSARRDLDVSGLVVAPGFIDMMGQTATPFLNDASAALNLLTQGITTINAGEGTSAAPLDTSSAKTSGWKTMAEYFAILEKKGLPLNVVQTVGHTQVRMIVLGDVDRRPTVAELKRMQELVHEAMQAGSIGVSTALIYPPAVYADTEEIASLVKVVGEYGGRYYTHMRNEGDRLLEAIDEALEIGEDAGTPVHIFHLKAAGRQNWGKMEQAIAKIKQARNQGRQVTADIYPYINNGLGIAAFIHPRNFGEGRERLLRQLNDPQVRARIRREMESEKGWENWYRHTGFDWSKVVLGSMKAEPYKKYNGQNLAVIAKHLNQDPWETFFEITKAGAFALPQSMSEANKIKAMQQEFISFCTDVGPAKGGTRIASHPRAYGSFPRILSRYVRDLGVISLEQAIAKMSAIAANEVFAYDRGKIAIGLSADIVVFDFERIADKATLADPRVPSVGMKYVLVNGRLVFEDGRYTGAKPGEVLRGPGYRRQKP